MPVLSSLVLLLCFGFCCTYTTGFAGIRVTTPESEWVPLKDTVTEYSPFPGVIETTTYQPEDTATARGRDRNSNDIRPPGTRAPATVPTRRPTPKPTASPTTAPVPPKVPDPTPNTNPNAENVSPTVPDTKPTDNQTPAPVLPLIIPDENPSTNEIPDDSTPRVPDIKPSNIVPEKVSPKLVELINKKCLEYSKFVWSKVYDPIKEAFMARDTCQTSEPLVVGGKDAKPKEFPHQVALGAGNKNAPSWYCGGSIISETFVLTAAHCNNYEGHQKIKWARIGDFNIESTKDDGPNAKPQTIGINHFIIHEDYRKGSKSNDIALVKLNDTLRFNEFVRPICLNTEIEFHKNYAIVTGWGDIKTGGRSSAVLQKANLTMFTQFYCNASWHKALRNEINRFDFPRMICAGNKTTDSCQGDSGGPLQLRLQEPYHCMFTQIGVVASGDKCAKGVPGIFMRVSAYVPWIVNHVWPNELL